MFCFTVKRTIALPRFPEKLYQRIIRSNCMHPQPMTFGCGLSPGIYSAKAMPHG